MSDQQCLLATVADCPNDDTPRLVYADRLDDQGDAAWSAHASFIRRQIAAARADGSRVSQRWPGKGTRLPQMFVPVAWADGETVPGTAFIHYAGGTGVVWRRGTLVAVSCGPDDRLRIGHEVLRQHPVRWVNLQLRPGDYHTLSFRQSRFAREGDWYVARRTGWTVRVRPGDMHRSRCGLTWDEIARLDARLFFEQVFPTMTIFAESGSPARLYPNARWPARIAVESDVAPPQGVTWP